MTTVTTVTTHWSEPPAPDVLSQPTTIDKELLFHGARTVGPATGVHYSVGEYLGFCQHPKERKKKKERLHLPELDIRKAQAR